MHNGDAGADVIGQVGSGMVSSSRECQLLNTYVLF